MYAIAADIGSSNTRLAVRNAIFSEESRAVADPSNSRRVLSFGAASRKFLNACEIYPVRGGIADVTLTALMLRRYAVDLLKRRSVFGTELFIAVPGCADDIEKDAALRMGREAGFLKVTLWDSLLSGAHGAGLDIGSQKAGMVVDIGRERTGMLVFANGGPILEKVVRIGSSSVDRRIRAFLAGEEGVLIGARTAENVKKSLGSPQIRVLGRDTGTGLPATRDVRPSVLREAALPCVELLKCEIASAFMLTPPDALSDIAESGITLIGGGAKRFGLCEDLEKKLGVPCRAAQNAENSTILGMQQRMISGNGLFSSDPFTAGLRA